MEIENNKDPVNSEQAINRHQKHLDDLSSFIIYDITTMFIEAHCKDALLLNQSRMTRLGTLSMKTKINRPNNYSLIFINDERFYKLVYDETCCHDEESTRKYLERVFKRVSYRNALENLLQITGPEVYLL